MAQNVQKFREIVFQLLYSRCFEGTIGELSLVMRQNAIPKKRAREAEKIVDTIWEKREELDQLIVAKAIGYELERISRIERSILRLGLYELLYTDLPDKVAITEAIRLTRKFATAEGGSFVNALLDAIYKDRDEVISEKPVTC
ncbi:MAG: hypothetical protein K940chlam6_00526 [Chlamydiae bacterium]|nr:hypothetical protein [Chlamydiota bacterium]